MKAPTLMAVARHRGTEFSNAAPASGESANFRSLSRGARQMHRRLILFAGVKIIAFHRRDATDV